MSKNIEISVIAAVNDEFVLQKNLLSSSILNNSNVEFLPYSNCKNIGSAYNRGIAEAKGELLVFVHQDVYIPDGWLTLISEKIKDLPESWAILGLVGINYDGRIIGRCWSNGLQKEIFGETKIEDNVTSVDEMLIIINKSSGICFDEHLPGWHLYGTDVVQQAHSISRTVHIIEAPVIHNSLPLIKYDKGFIECYKYMRKKWSNKLPIKTCCVDIKRNNYDILKCNLKSLMLRNKKEKIRRQDFPEIKSKELGYDNFI